MGVFPVFSAVKRSSIDLPHARGGVSHIASHTRTKSQSSPRPWGCFLSVTRSGVLTKIFPTPVGVFPTNWKPGTNWRNLPHARGGVSEDLIPASQVCGSSPRPWGCFCTGGNGIRTACIFPTPVGVFLLRSLFHFSFQNLPHARGGVSVTVTD